MSAPAPVVIPPDRVWTAEDQEMYEELRDDAMDAGKSTDRAEAIARRAVVDRRKAEGRQPDEPEPDPRALPDALEIATREELYDRAKDLGIPGRSRMTKEELVAAIREKEAEAEAAAAEKTAAAEAAAENTAAEAGDAPAGEKAPEKPKAAAAK